MIRLDGERAKHGKGQGENETPQKGTWKEQRVTMYQAVAPLACPAMVDRRFELDRGRFLSLSLSLSLPPPLSL